jgi:hypothetical protein
MSKPLLTADAVYQKIQQYYNANGAKIDIKQLFDSDPKRFEKYSFTLKTPADGDILLVKFQKYKNCIIFMKLKNYLGLFQKSHY